MLESTTLLLFTYCSCYTFSPNSISSVSLHPPRQKYPWIFYTCGMKTFMTQRLKAIKTYKSFLCQSDTHSIETYALIPMETHKNYWQTGNLSQCSSVKDHQKQICGKSSWIYTGYSEGDYTASRTIVLCKVLEHIQPGVPKLWAWTSTSCQISANIRLEIKCTIKILCLSHPETFPPTPGPWKNCLPWNQFLVSKDEDCWYTGRGLWFWEASMQD